MLDDSTPRPEPDPTPDAKTPASAAHERFRTCRWRAQAPDPASDYCTHRDVQPFAGTAAFNPEAWCPDCRFYKVRRTPRKREEY